MRWIKERLLLFILLTAVWLLLTLPLDRQEVYAGAAAALILSLLPWGKSRILGDVRLNPKSLIFSVFYLFVFLKALVLANLDVAYRVVSPRLPINPGIVRVKTKLQSPIGRIFLANSITLTPGTITVETRGEDFYIHWIDVHGEDFEERTKQIVLGFEKYLEVIFG